MEHAMNDEGIARLERALALGWKPSTMKPEHRGAEFPGTEDFPNGWFKAGVFVATNGTIHHSVEPHHIIESDAKYIPSESVLPILLSQ